MIIKKMPIKNEETDLELIKKHEKKVRKYQDKVKSKDKNDERLYKHLAYKVSNPFKGV